MRACGHDPNLPLVGFLDELGVAGVAAREELDASAHGTPLGTIRTDEIPDVAATAATVGAGPFAVRGSKVAHAGDGNDLGEGLGRGWHLDLLLLATFVDGDHAPILPRQPVSITKRAGERLVKLVHRKSDDGSVELVALLADDYFGGGHLVLPFDCPYGTSSVRTVSSPFSPPLEDFTTRPLQVTPTAESA